MNGFIPNRPTRRTRLHCVAAATAACLLAASPARAEFPHPAFYVGLYGGGNLVLRDWDFGANDHQKGAVNLPYGPARGPGTTDALLPGHGGLGGLRLGVQIVPQLALEGEVAYLGFSSTAGGGNTTLTWDLNLLIHLLKGNWTPVLEFGVGAYHNLKGDLGNDSDPRAHVGIGLRGLLAPWVAFRVDVRDIFTDGFDAFGGNNLEVTAGFDFFAAAAKAKADRDGDGIADADDACPDAAGPESTKGCPTGDRDHDGVLDAQDICPDVASGKTPDPARAGCPTDRDHDGVPDDSDLCPDVPAGKFPDAAKNGCPADRDADGVIDEEDHCVDVAAGTFPDLVRRGCPNDRDGDGVIDEKDKCMMLAAGKLPDAARPGCPSDRDGDGVIDEKDQCVDVAAGPSPDAARAGCPADRDGDSVSDPVDACPDKAGSPDPDPKKNGCPGLVSIKDGQILILDQVYFATGKEDILPKSFPVLTSVSHAIKSLPAGRRIAIEGYTDNQGKAEENVRLSQLRAEAVKKWLVDHAVSGERLDPKGYGDAKPLAPNTTAPGRAKNRRVEFHIEAAK